MASKNPPNQPIEDVEVPDSEDDGVENCYQPPPEEKLKGSEDEEYEEDKSKEDSEEDEEEEDKEETDETEGESGEEEEHASPKRAPTQSNMNKGGGVNERNPTSMINSAARKEETDDSEKRKMEIEVRIEQLDISLKFIELQKRMVILKRKAWQYNIPINDEEGEGGGVLPSKKRCDWCSMLKHLP